jgi:hypothetical protein
LWTHDERVLPTDLLNLRVFTDPKYFACSNENIKNVRTREGYITALWNHGKGEVMARVKIYQV